MGGKVYVGTSGWNYKDWRGNYFDEDVPKRRWLEVLAEGLDSVEVNNSFYRVPTEAQVRAWADQTPQRFRIALKMWRGVTHYKKLKEPEDKLRRFFGAARGLPTRQRGPILVQLPPNQGKDVARLDDFLTCYKEVLGGERWRTAMEFRHGSWYDDETVSVLDRHRVALCVHDMRGKGDVDEPNDASFVYMRRHGPGGDIRRPYSAKQLRRDADQVEDWLDAGKTVYVYYNNDHQGYAPKNAEALKGRLNGAG